MEDCPRKKIRENNDNTLDIEESEKVIDKSSQQYITYDVLRLIFEYLNGMELSNASMVCRSWLEAANNEMRTRGPTYLMGNCGNLVHYLPNAKSDEKCIKTQMVQKLRIKPALGLFFIPPLRHFNKQDCHCKVLPSNCQSITLSTYGIIINDKEIQDNLEYIVGVFLPDLPNLTIKTIPFKHDVLFRINGTLESEKKYIEEIKAVLDTSEKDCDASKCLLLFCTLQGRSSAIKIANALKRCYKTGKLSVWGGVAMRGFVCNSKESENNQCERFTSCTAIVLIGAIDTWSLVVDKSCKTKEQVEQRLKLFKNHICLKKHSMAFMFACRARGENMFHECNVESSIFKRLFPKIPLVGCFGDGEFGENKMSNESSNNKKTKWYNEMSTIFLIITYG